MFFDHGYLILFYTTNEFIELKTISINVYTTKTMKIPEIIIENHWKHLVVFQNLDFL